jgi:hypothetical protein
MAPSQKASVRFDSDRRAREKERSRAADALALAGGKAAAIELRAQNEAFVRIGQPGRIDLSSARALA